MVITLSQKVTNRELNLHGEAVVQQMVLRSFISLLVEQILPKLEGQLHTEPCQVVDTVDYNLSPFRFSQQFGVEYKAELVIMTPEELEEHDQAQCQSCTWDQVMQEDFGEGTATC